jgi:hypothetical protein
MDYLAACGRRISNGFHFYLVLMDEGNTKDITHPGIPPYQTGRSPAK